jgi:uncharacterized protein YjbJ (UPF0337 family)
MYKDIFEGKWTQFKSVLKKTWNDLSDEDLEKIKGKKNDLVGLIQASYGETKEAIEQKVNKLIKSMK